MIKAAATARWFVLTFKRNRGSGVWRSSKTVPRTRRNSHVIYILRVTPVNSKI